MELGRTNLSTYVLREKLIKKLCPFTTNPLIRKAPITIKHAC
jgi:hypothetical protein